MSLLHDLQEQSPLQQKLHQLLHTLQQKHPQQKHPHLLLAMVVTLLPRLMTLAIQPQPQLVTLT